MNDVHVALARGNVTTVVMLDQLTVFDVIGHCTLLDCLSSWFGIDSVVVD